MYQKEDVRKKKYIMIDSGVLWVKLVDVTTMCYGNVVTVEMLSLWKCCCTLDESSLIFLCMKQPCMRRCQS